MDQARRQLTRFLPIDLPLMLKFVKNCIPYHISIPPCTTALFGAYILIPNLLQVNMAQEEGEDH